MKKENKILVVDDEQESAVVLAELLKNAGFSVSTAADGFKAIASCKVKNPDVILLDLEMPLMGGKDVFKRLRSEEKTSSIPVIFLVETDRQAEMLKSSELGELDFLKKPVDWTDLKARVDTALRVKALKDELRRKEGELAELTLTDPLTSFRNSRFLNEFLETEIKQARRYKIPLSFILMEVDQYRQLLKSKGQNALDAFVTQLAAVLSRQNRDSDVLARLNDNEFAVVLPHTDRQGAVEVAERTRNAVSAATFSFGDQAVSVTMSLGICELTDQMDEPAKTLIANARMALKQAGQAGGNVTLMAH